QHALAPQTLNDFQDPGDNAATDQRLAGPDGDQAAVPVQTGIGKVDFFSQQRTEVSEQSVIPSHVAGQDSSSDVVPVGAPLGGQGIPVALGAHEPSADDIIRQPL